MGKKIEYYLYNLDWNNSREIQEESMKVLENIKEEDMCKLVQPYTKNHWENAAKVIKRIGCPKVLNIIPQLLEWLQDLNWPGAIIILSVLQDIEKSVLLPEIEKVIIKIVEDEDELWLCGIKELTKKLELNQKERESIKIP